MVSILGSRHSRIKVDHGRSLHPTVYWSITWRLLVKTSVDTFHSYCLVCYPWINPDDTHHCTTIPIPKRHGPNLSGAGNYRRITPGPTVRSYTRLHHIAALGGAVGMQWTPARFWAASFDVYLYDGAHRAYRIPYEQWQPFILRIPHTFNVCDKVEYCSLFRAHEKIYIPPAVVRVLLNNNTGQQISVLRNGINFNSSSSP